MSSANPFNLDQSKILSFGKDLNAFWDMEKIVVKSISSFSLNVPYSIKDKFCHLIYH